MIWGYLCMKFCKPLLVLIQQVPEKCIILEYGDKESCFEENSSILLSISESCFPIIQFGLQGIQLLNSSATEGILNEDLAVSFSCSAERNSFSLSFRFKTFTDTSYISICNRFVKKLLLKYSYIQSHI